jgi:uncharacterized ParB-like nuclease family protein
MTTGRKMTEHEIIADELANAAIYALVDASERYALACHALGVPERTGRATILAKLVRTVAETIAVTTHMPAHEAGAMLDGAVLEMRVKHAADETGAGQAPSIVPGGRG